MRMLNEFKKFIAKGNVLEIAVGLIMATYFGAIAKSLVNDVLMPPLGLALKGVNFNKFKIVLQEAIAESAPGANDAIPEVAIAYGQFLNTVLTFILVAFAVFLVIRTYNRMKERWEKKVEAQPKEPSKEELLLTEIRDLLKEK